MSIYERSFKVKAALREVAAFHDDPVSLVAITPPPVRVTIGRIEVTALTEAAPSKRVAAERKPKIPLDEYLARRHGRNR